MGRINYSAIYIQQGNCAIGPHRNDNLPRKTCKDCWERRKKRQRESRRVTKERAFNKYGGRCACCKEGRSAFLSIDHINNDGKKELTKPGVEFYSELLRTPLREDIRVLCHNCNQGRRINGGICPHDEPNF